MLTAHSVLSLYYKQGLYWRVVNYEVHLYEMNYVIVQNMQLYLIWYDKGKHRLLITILAKVSVGKKHKEGQIKAVRLQQITIVKVRYMYGT